MKNAFCSNMDGPRNYLSEVREIQILYDITHMWNLKKNTNELIYKTGIDSQTQKANLWFSSIAQFCLTLCDPMNHSTPGLPVHHQLQEFTQTPGVHSDSSSIESVMPSSHPILGRPLLLPPPIPPSIRVFSNESTLCMSGQSTGVSALASFLPEKSQG